VRTELGVVPSPALNYTFGVLRRRERAQFRHSFWSCRWRIWYIDCLLACRSV